VTRTNVATAPRKSGEPPVTAEWVTVTPELATKWLGQNAKNRHQKLRVIARYVRDMTANDWALTGDPIRFSADGQLLDGQHRLVAIVESGASVVMLVVSGLDRRAQDVMDTGAKRTAADALTIHETTNAATVASIARLVVAYQDGTIRTADTQFLGEVSHSQILHAVATDPTINWAVGLTRTTCKTLPASASAVGFAAWLGAQVDPEDVRTFLTDVAEMRTSGVGDPRHTLLRRLQSAKDQRERLTSIQQAWLIWRAWIAQHEGEQLKLLKMSTAAGARPFPTPRSTAA
jgi:hypothetical protein